MFADFMCNKNKTYFWLVSIINVKQVIVMSAVETQKGTDSSLLKTEIIKNLPRKLVVFSWENNIYV